ncbi:unnamed protein product [Meloidogyne enterolobii]|uniref:Uncharacterized protein n=1 Tax=Meloidogyne enterolobii TaxID=390850 RepID=A0ACB0Y592_MELEN
MEPFYRVQLDDEEYLLLRSIMYSHFVTNGVSKEGQKVLLSEAEKYSKILMKMLQVYIFLGWVNFNSICLSKIYMGKLTDYRFRTKNWEIKKIQFGRQILIWPKGVLKI